MKIRSRNNVKILILVVLVAFAAGLAIGVQKREEIRSVVESSPVVAGIYNVDDTNFIPSNVTISGTHVGIYSGCREISFDVTEDQAFSIQRAMSGVLGARPLTHDILKDILENFNIKILRVRIERFGEEIYYARMFVQQNGKVLDIDIRPSDAIALSLRTGDALYINRTMLNEKGTNIC